ncbi:MAG: transposase [Christensenellales bacterium]
MQRGTSSQAKKRLRVRYILNAFDCPYSNGSTEGVNNTIRVINASVTATVTSAISVPESLPTSTTMRADRSLTINSHLSLFSLTPTIDIEPEKESL